MKILTAAAVALLLAGCASQQVNRTAKSDKMQVSAKTDRPVSQQTPNQAIKHRWYDGFRVRWFKK